MRSRGTLVNSRRGATAVETAIVIPVVLMCTVGLCIMGLGVFRYEQVSTLRAKGHGTRRFTAASTRPTRGMRRRVPRMFTIMRSNRWRRD